MCLECFTCMRKQKRIGIQSNYIDHHLVFLLAPLRKYIFETVTIIQIEGTILQRTKTTTELDQNDRRKQKCFASFNYSVSATAVQLVFFAYFFPSLRILSLYPIPTRPFVVRVLLHSLSKFTGACATVSIACKCKYVSCQQTICMFH